MKNQAFIVDARLPNRIIRQSDDEQQYLVSYGKNQVLEDKLFMELNYPELVEDYNLFKIVGERYDQEFISQKSQQFAFFQFYENSKVEQNLATKSNKVQKKTSRKQAQNQRCLNFRDIQIDSTLKESKIAIKMKASDGNITNKASVAALIKITNQLQDLGYKQEEIQVRFSKIVDNREPSDQYKNTKE